MKFNFVFIIFLLIFINPLLSFSLNSDDITKAVVKVYTENPAEGNLHFCNGFIVKKDEKFYLITANHVFYDKKITTEADKLLIVNSNGKKIILEKNELNKNLTRNAGKPGERVDIAVVDITQNIKMKGGRHISFNSIADSKQLQEIENVFTSTANMPAICWIYSYLNNGIFSIKEVIVGKSLFTEAPVSKGQKMIGIKVLKGKIFAGDCGAPIMFYGDTKTLNSGKVIGIITTDSGGIQKNSPGIIESIEMAESKLNF